MYSRETETAGTSGSSLRNRLSALADRAGLLQLSRTLWSRSLSVVNYHRIDDASRPGFDSFKPNVSADPEAFSQQLAYLRKWFNVIPVERLVEWLDGVTPLPPRAALITFDDGYLDNYTHAYPILRQHNLPALIFLTTGHIGTDRPFYWDLAAYCFYHTGRERVRFPSGTERQWADANEREQVCKTWIEAMKVLPEAEKTGWVQRLPQELDVAIPAGYFRRLMLDWDLVREMGEGGIAFGGHTLTHPILTRIPPGQAELEIRGSKERIHAELGRPPLGFAYPNGMQADLNREVEQIVAGAGYRTAFTLMNGPAGWSEIRREPYRIRRIFISHRHSLGQFAALLSPLNRLRSN
ncbi:MAG: polysaccharide deacetylase family protein [Bacteroidota bacterium]